MICDFIKHILLVVIFFTSSIAQVEEKNDNMASVKKFTIDNCVNGFESSKVVKTEVGYQYWFADKEFIDGQTLKLSVVAPHSATHPPHKHKEDEFFFVLEGTAEFFLDGKTKIAGSYTSFYCPSNIEHGIRNAGDTELKYLVIKKYDIK